jgi:DNA-binding transcriptional ArsR family regulator
MTEANSHSENDSLGDAALIYQHADAATRQLKALSNVNRLMILCILCERELSVTDLNELVDISQSALSQHLARLRDDQMVQTRRESQTIYYSIADGVAKDIIQVLHNHYCKV